MSSLNPLTIVEYEEDINLRTISWNQKFLEKTAAAHKLRHGEAVVFVNVARSKVRLVVVFYGMAVLMLPPIDPKLKISLYLKINEFLRRFCSRPNITSFIEGEITEARERLERSAERKRLAASAAKKRRKAA